MVLKNLDFGRNGFYDFLFLISYFLFLISYFLFLISYAIIVFMNLRKWLCFSLCFLVQGFAGTSSERSVLELCPECLSGDKTAEELRRLNVVACEQIVKSKECREVEPKYLRSCEEEEEDPWAFGQRVLGCVKGGLLEVGIGLGAGFVLGKVILGMGALLSLPVVGPALGITAGGGATLYVFTEYDRAYREVGPGDGRAWRAAGKLLGEVGTVAYRLLLGNYECYSSEGRAWEVCGLLLGTMAGATGVMGATMTMKGKAASEAFKKGISKLGLSKPQENLFHNRIIKNSLSYSDLADLRKAGMSMDDIGKAVRMPEIKSYLKGTVKEDFENKLEHLAKAKSLLGQTRELSERQVRGVGDITDRSAQSWERIVRGIQNTGLSVDDAISVRQSSLGFTFGSDKYLNRTHLMNYMKNREVVERSIGRRFTESQSKELSFLQKLTEGRMVSQRSGEAIRHRIKRLVDSGLSHRQLREMVDHDLIHIEHTLISRDFKTMKKRKLKEWIDDLAESAK